MFTLQQRIALLLTGLLTTLLLHGCGGGGSGSGNSESQTPPSISAQNQVAVSELTTAAVLTLPYLVDGLSLNNASTLHNAALASQQPPISTSSDNIGVLSPISFAMAISHSGRLTSRIPKFTGCMYCSIDASMGVNIRDTMTLSQVADDISLTANSLVVNSANNSYQSIQSTGTLTFALTAPRTETFAAYTVTFNNFTLRSPDGALDLTVNGTVPVQEETSDTIHTLTASQGHLAINGKINSQYVAITHSSLNFSIALDSSKSSYSHSASGSFTDSRLPGLPISYQTTSPIQGDYSYVENAVEAPGLKWLSLDRTAPPAELNGAIEARDGQGNKVTLQPGSDGQVLSQLYTGNSLLLNTSSFTL